MLHAASINSKIFNILTAVFFIILISVPAVKLVVSPLEEVSIVEKRKLAALPEVPTDLSSFTQYPEKFTSFFNDHFGYRDLMMRCYHYVKIVVLKTSPQKKWIIGKDNWEFITLNNMVEDFRGLDPYRQKELETIRKKMQTRQYLLQRLGIQYVVVIAPNKQTIYPEYLPDNIKKVNPETRLDQLVTFLQGSDVNFLDIRTPLLAAKKKELLYLPKNSHWNEKGAFVAYQAVINYLNKWYPGLKTLDASQLSIENKRSTRPGIYNTVGLFDENVPHLTIVGKKASPDTRYDDFVKLFKNRYREAYKKPIVSKNDSGTYKIAVFRDSFFTDLHPFFSESFNQAIYFYEPYNEQVISQLLYSNFKPDIILEEMVERDLWRVQF